MVGRGRERYLVEILVSRWGGGLVVGAVKMSCRCCYVVVVVVEWLGGTRG